MRGIGFLQDMRMLDRVEAVLDADDRLNEGLDERFG
jgi:hypothetical protein